MEVVEEATTTEKKPEQNTSEEKTTGEGVEVIEARDPTTRPIYRLSVKLIDTYKHINKIYYEAKANRLREQQGESRGGVYNDGYDDQNYDYIIHGDEIFAERYILKHRIGKGSFGQVVCAYDRQTQSDVAIKIIKSKHAFMVQARTEIKLLRLVLEKDNFDDQNVVRLLDTFVFRNHQCLVFEMLSYNLYELLKNTRFKGVSLGLVRKFAKQILRGLEFLSREDVDIIHCDLKPENILLRHPKRSAIKIIDFGSSCLSTKKTYTYIQSRFYRSPEVLLGLPYSQKIDMWSLGCVLVEMHTGEPLFGGVNQLDQLNRIISVLGMLPPEMVEKCPTDTRNNFFDVVESAPDAPTPATNAPAAASETVAGDSSASEPPATAGNASITTQSQIDRLITINNPATNEPTVLSLKTHKEGSESKRRGSDYTPRTLEEIVGVDTSGPQGRRAGDPGHTKEMYTLFVDFIKTMLVYDPAHRVTPTEALQHPYLHVNPEAPTSTGEASAGATSAPKAERGEEQESSASQRGNAILGSTRQQVEEPQGKRRSLSAPRLTYTSPYTSTKKTITTDNASTATTADSTLNGSSAQTGTSDHSNVISSTGVTANPSVSNSGRCVGEDAPAASSAPDEEPSTAGTSGHEGEA